MSIFPGGPTVASVQGSPEGRGQADYQMSWKFQFMEEKHSHLSQKIVL